MKNEGGFRQQDDKRTLIIEFSPETKWGSPARMREIYACMLSEDNDTLLDDCDIQTFVHFYLQLIQTFSIDTHVDPATSTRKLIIQGHTDRPKLDLMFTVGAGE